MLCVAGRQTAASTQLGVGRSTDSITTTLTECTAGWSFSPSWSSTAVKIDRTSAG
jgi:hypothetical protein